MSKLFFYDFYQNLGPLPVDIHGNFSMVIFIIHLNSSPRPFNVKICAVITVPRLFHKNQGCKTMFNINIYYIIFIYIILLYYIHRCYFEPFPVPIISLQYSSGVPMLVKGSEVVS